MYITRKTDQERIKETKHITEVIRESYENIKNKKYKANGT